MPSDKGSLSSSLWPLLPLVLLPAAYFGRKYYLSYRLRKHGIGRGAPGFQTNVRKIVVTPEIMARLRRGETVSPAEIAACQADSAAQERTESKVEEKKDEVNEWLPPSLTSKKTPKRGKRR